MMKELTIGQNLDGRLEIFAIGWNDLNIDGCIYHNWQTAASGNWSSQALLGTADNKAKRLATGRHQNGRIEVCTVGANNRVYHLTQTAANNGWTAEQAMSAKYVISISSRSARSPRPTGTKPDWGRGAPD